MPQQYLSTDPNAGTPVDGYLSTDANAGQPATAAQASVAAGPPSAVSRFAEQFWDRANPMQWIHGLVETAKHPVDAATNLVRADPKFLEDAKTAYERGDKATAARKVLSFLAMGFGHDLDAQADLLQKGDIAGGTGAMAGMATSFLAPEAVAPAAKAIAGARLSPRVTPSPTISDAAALAKREGIPLDAATATDRPIVRSVQKKVSDSLGGAGTAERFKAQQSERLATVGDQLAAKANAAPQVGPLQPGQPRPLVPGPAVTTEQAGTLAQNTVRNVVHDQHVAATAQYEKLRAIEAQPQHQRTVTLAGPEGDAAVPMALPVDLRATKSALSDLYTRLQQEGEVAPLMGEKATAARILQRLVTGPDYAPLSTVDAALGELKSFIRADNPDLRTVGQASIVDAVRKLDADVQATARSAGPDAVRALTEGRAATTAKYIAADVLKGLERGSGEPVAAYNRLTARGDAGVMQLRDVARHAPETMPQIARAVLDTLMEKATADGGFQHAQAVRAQWKKLGPETKAILFRDPAYVKDLDSFFALAEKIAENPNPSGTARINNLFNVTSSAVGFPLAKLLYSKRGVQLLTQGLVLPTVSPIAVAAWTDRLRKLGIANGLVQASQHPAGQP